jgi:hypothetical protein
MCRKWLEQKEIIFRTVFYSLVSLATIVLLFQANKISDTQVQIMEQQSKIQKYQQTPSIFAKVELVLDPITNKYTNDILVIYNDGAPLHYFSDYSAIFFEMQYGKKGTEIQTILIPILDYYQNTFYTGNRIDKIMYLTAQYNNERQIQVQNDLMSYASSNDYYGLLEVKRYLEVKYYDKFNEEHVEYHYIDPIVGGGMIENPPVTKNAVIDLIELHRQAQLRNIGVSLYEVTPAVLISKYEIAKEVYKEYPLIVRFLEWQRSYK